jgi:hypothetical protein
MSVLLDLTFASTGDALNDRPAPAEIFLEMTYRCRLFQSRWRAATNHGAWMT